MRTRRINSKLLRAVNVVVNALWRSAAEEKLEPAGPSGVPMEMLERRMLYDGTPNIVGDPVAEQGHAYTLNLEANGATFDHWVINWGDGGGTPDVQTVSFSATMATHTFTTGSTTFDVTAEAINSGGGVAADCSLYSPDTTFGTLGTLVLSGQAIDGETNGDIVVFNSDGSVSQYNPDGSLDWNSPSLAATEGGGYSDFSEQIFAVSSNGDVAVGGVSYDSNGFFVDVYNPSDGSTSVLNFPGDGGMELDDMQIDGDTVYIQGSDTPNGGPRVDLCYSNNVGNGPEDINYEATMPGDAHYNNGNVTLDSDDIESTVSDSGTFTVSRIMPVGTLTVVGTLGTAGSPSDLNPEIAPVGSATEGSPFTINLNANGSSFDYWVVNWGDGSGGSQDLQVLASSVTAAVHTYTSTGQFAVSAYSVDRSGSVVSSTQLGIDPSFGTNGPVDDPTGTVAAEDVTSDGKLIVFYTDTSVEEFNADGSTDWSAGPITSISGFSDFSQAIYAVNSSGYAIVTGVSENSSGFYAWVYEDSSTPVEMDFPAGAGMELYAMQPSGNDVYISMSYLDNPTDPGSREYDIQHNTIGHGSSDIVCGGSMPGNPDTNDGTAALDSGETEIAELNGDGNFQTILVDCVDGEVTVSS